MGTWQIHHIISHTRLSEGSTTQPATLLPPVPARTRGPEDTEQWEPHALLAATGGGAATLQDGLAVRYKMHIFPPCNSVIVPLGVYPKELKSYVHTEPCTQMLMAALFTNAQIWKPSPRSSVGECVNRLRTVQEWECCLTLERSEPSSQEGTWANRQCRILSEGSPSEKAPYGMTPTL